MYTTGRWDQVIVLNINERAQQMRAEQQQRAAHKAAEEARKEREQVAARKATDRRIEELARQFARWANRNGYQKNYRGGWFFTRRGWELKSDWDWGSEWKGPDTYYCIIWSDGTISYTRASVYQLESSITKIVADSGKSWP